MSWLRMGVAHAHGLRGELKVVLDNESSTLRWAGLSARLSPKDGSSARELRVVTHRRAGPLAFVTLEGVGDRDAAEALEGHVLSLSRAALPELGDDEVYLADLVGLAVEHGGERLGVVERIEVYPSSSALVVSTADRELEIPIHPPYVEEVDLRARTVRVARLAELLADTDTAQPRREG
ncbi:MAG: ribosome maturation factor RimM [Deltaproteobacteria bacterium]|jgi:16S rRNA processing protein RimM